MIKVMFVCHGNICRSPMAEFIMKKLVAENELTDKISISSSATSSEEIWGGRGNPVYPPAKKELEKHGISCGGKTAVQLTKDDYSKYDMLIGMDSANIRNMNRICGGDNDNKIYKLLSFAGRDDDVSDPWFTGRFDVAYNDIYEGCLALLEYLRNI